MRSLLYLEPGVPTHRRKELKAAAFAKRGDVNDMKRASN